MLYRLVASFLCVLLLPQKAFAHVKWFIPLDGKVSPDFVRYAISDTEVIVWICIGIMLVTGSVILDSRLPSIPIVETRARRIIFAILRIATGISLLLTAYNGSIIAPHYQADGNLAEILLALEAVVGLLLITNKFVFHASILLIVLYLGVMIRFGFMEVLEYLNIMGIGVFLLFNNFLDNKYKEKLKPYSVSALRILTGIALVTLGFSEKLLFPEYGEAFVEAYKWNFVQNLGFENFSDRLFVLSAGTMEVVFGIILILGTTTRLNILVLAGFMLTSNTTFIVEGNISQAITEIIGHLPIIAIAVICVFFGSGQKWKITSILRTGSKKQEFP